MALDALGAVGWPIGVAVVAVVVSLGRVVVGTPYGVAAGPLPACAELGANESSPTTATPPTTAAGTTNRVTTTERIRCPIYLRRKRQA
jgi:hypothetical protein